MKLGILRFAEVNLTMPSQKAQDKITELTRWLSQNSSTARTSDVSAASQLIRDLQNALKGN